MENRDWGIVEKIVAYPGKGKAGEDLAEGRFVKDRGLDGDFHATGGDKQVSLQFAQGSKVQEERGLCSRFRANLNICGLECAAPGTRLMSGSTILEISGETKHCYEECPLFKTMELCSLSGMSLFARVLEGGLIHVGDKVSSI